MPKRVGGEEGERCPWPPVGQLEFDDITAMNEETLDRAFKERHGLDRVFKEGYYARDSGKRVELKRIILARMEGYSMIGPELSGWYADPTPEGGDPANALNSRFSQVLTSEARKRITKVGKSIAREALVLAPPERLKEIEQKIQHFLRLHKEKPLTIEQILNRDRLPIAREISEKTFFDIERALKFYLLVLQGFTQQDAGIRVGFSDGRENGVMLSRHYSLEARNVLRRIRGAKEITPREDKGTTHAKGSGGDLPLSAA